MSRIFRNSWVQGVLSLLAPRRCPGCDELATGFCGICEALLDPTPDRLFCFEYGGPLAVALRQMKYARRVDYVAPLAALWVSRAEYHRGFVDAIVTIPASKERLREVGFDWVALLAEPLATELGVPVFRRGLQRVRRTRAQASLPRAQRERNVSSAFRAAELPPRILLVDDVRTTGATLRAGEQALRDGGATRVRTMALAGVV